MLKIFDIVGLSHDIDEEGLFAGDIGTIIDILSEEEGVYEVEFAGDDLKVITLKHVDIYRIE